MTPTPIPRSRAAIRGGVIAGVLGVVGSFAVTGRSSAFVVVPVNGLVVDAMPAPVLTVGILWLGRVAELVGFVLSIGLTVTILGTAALFSVAIGRHFDDRPAAVMTALGLAWGTVAALTGDLLTASAAAIPVAGVVLVVLRRPVEQEVDRRRRAALRAAGSAVAIGAGVVLGVRHGNSSPTRLSAIPSSEQSTIRNRLEAADRRALDVSGIPGLVSEVDQFYEVDIDPVNPVVDPADWSLTIGGAVDDTPSLDYDDLLAFAPSHRFVTLRCVGEPVNGELMDTALWTGVPVKRLLEEAGVFREATHVVLKAVDGFFEEFPITTFRDSLVAYGMNGRLLPRKHGAPVRAVVPGHWGEVHVKWLSAIDVITREKRGYWERRGWHGTGPVNTVAKLWTVNRRSGGRIQVGGHAFAGTRGIRAVEVSIDGGETWTEARLSERLPGRAVWRQWVHEYAAPAGPHEVVVRAVEDDGTIQPQDPRNAFPSGATGWVARRIDP